ncbi:MAG: hypothetical protein FWD83_04230 [Promicromonosporaceae bacterium]|nr:hypothetical protein [Promicromonosporaceae bacterium]
MDRVQQKQALFAQNWRALAPLHKEGFRVENRRLAAFFFAHFDRQADCEAIRAARWLVESHSNFANNGAFVAVLLAVHGGDVELLNRINVVRDLLVAAGFHGDSHYLGLACYLIATGTEPENYPHTAERTAAFYSGLAACENFDALESFYPYAALLGLSAQDVAGGVVYAQELRLWLWQSYILHFHAAKASEAEDTGPLNPFGLPALAIAASDGHGAERAVALLKALNNRKVWRPGFVVFSVILLPLMHTLGLLAQIPIDDATLARELRQMQRLLKRQRGFSQLTVGKHQFYVTNSSLVASAHCTELRQAGQAEAAARLSRLTLCTQFTGVFGSWDEEMAKPMGSGAVFGAPGVGAGGAAANALAAKHEQKVQARSRK